MSTANTLNKDQYEALSVGFFTVPDPGDAGTVRIEAAGRTIVEVVTAGAETRVLPDASDLPVGAQCELGLKTAVGNLTIDTDDDDVVLTAAGDLAIFQVVPSGTDKVWKLVSRSGDSAALIALQADVQKTYTVAIPLTDFRVHDAFQTVLPGTAATDDLGIKTATIGTNFSNLNAAASAASVVQEGVALVTVPPNYQAGSSLSLSIPWTRSNAAEVAATLDVKVFRAAAPTVDLYAGAAVDVNAAASGTAAFALTSTALVPGEQLLVNLIATLDDTAGSGAAVELTAVNLVYTV